MPDQPTAALAAPAIGPRPLRQGGFAVSPLLIMPVVALLLLACLFGVLQSGLVRVAWWANPGPATPGPTRVAGGIVPTATAAGAPAPATETTPAPALPTQPPISATEPPAPPPAPTVAGGTRGNPVFPTPTVPLATAHTVTLEDVAFVGAYRYQPPSEYEGRTAAWVYGPGTGFETMRAVFDVTGQPGGTAGLTLSGMDSEDKAKTPMRILINDQPIFDAPNPLPNDFSPNAGSWGLYTWTFDAALLHPGRNTLTIENVGKKGKIGQPPFIMVDFARLEWEREQ